MLSLEIKIQLNKNLHYLSVLIWFLYIPLSLHSQDEKTIVYKNLGFQFSIPDEWEGKETEAVYVLTSPEEQGFVSINTLPFNNIVEYKKQLTSGISKDNGFFLAPADQIEVIGENRLQGKFSGMINYTPAIAYIIVISGVQQQMVMIMAADSKENYSDRYEFLANEITQSFKFFKPQMPSIVDEYKSMLNDTKLTFVESEDFSDSDISMGHKAKTTIDLCSEGYFNFYNFRSEGMVSAFSTNKNKGAGQWDVIKGDDGNIVLQLKYYDGEVSDYSMEYINGKIYLDGDHYLKTTDTDFKYKPECN